MARKSDSAEQDELAIIKFWLRENGQYLLAGIIFGVAVLVSWKGYEYYQFVRSERASLVYLDLEDSLLIEDEQSAFDKEKILRTQYIDKIYYPLALLQLAKFEIKRNNLQSARSYLLLAEVASENTPLVDVVVSRLVRLYLAMDDLVAARAMLAKHDFGIGFDAFSGELYADTLFRQGDLELAMAGYRRALQRGGVGRDFIRMKLQDMGVKP